MKVSVAAGICKYENNRLKFAQHLENQHEIGPMESIITYT
jgi:hypothetical protein